MTLVSGSWYEPASLWSAQYVAVPDSTSPNTTVTFNRQHFRNGGRHPIVLQRLAACGVNYVFDRTGAAGFDAAAYAAGADAAIMQASVRIGIPFRKNFSRYTIPLSQYTPKPTGTPRTAGTTESSLWGISYLRFPRPILLPQRSSIEGGVTFLKNTRQPFTSEGDPIDTLPSPMNAYMYFHEAGGLFSGSARIKALQVRTDATSVVPVPDPYGCIPYPLPEGAIPPPPPLGATAERLWPPQSQMSSRDFEQQESTRSGSTEVYGTGFFVDQLTYDQALLDQIGGNDADTKISQLSTRLGVRMRAKHSPDGQWWWRPGAPLALVYDTITPAVVYELPEPITLAPGDAINVTMQLPGGVTPHGAGFNVGLSFNGYKAIEG